MITVQSQSTLDLWHLGDPATGMATFILRTLYVITDPGNGQREAIFPEVRTAQSLEIVDFFHYSAITSLLLNSSEEIGLPVGSVSPAAATVSVIDLMVFRAVFSVC